MKRSIAGALLLSAFFSVAVAAEAQPSRLVSVARPAATKPATFQIITPPITGTWANFALAEDGSTMAANYGGELFLWTAAHGFTDLGMGDMYSSSVGISSNGSFIVGTRKASDGNTTAQRWSLAGGWLDLGHPANGCSLSGNWTDGYSVNKNGSAVVGLAWNCRTRAEGFVWTQQGGMISLGRPTGVSSRASSISSNGSTIVGFAEDPATGVRRAVRWRSGGESLFAGAHTPGEATAVSSDGSQIVGQSSPSACPSGCAFYYTDAGGLVSLGTISHSASDNSVANGISDDGTVIGWSGNQFGGVVRGFIWSPSRTGSKMLSLHAYLLGRGVKMPANLYLSDAISISADGHTIVGTWQDANFHQGNFISHI